MLKPTTFKLRQATSPRWTEVVMADFDLFLVDHAGAEKKASGMATSMLSHYPDKPELVNAMVDLAIEELAHFREVVKIIHKRGLQLQADSKDPYVNQLHKHMRRGKEVYMLDRLLIGGIVEARGCERFGLLAKALPPGELQQFYQAIEKSEARHESLFYDLAAIYFSESEIAPRLDELLDAEARIMTELPITPALH